MQHVDLERATLDPFGGALDFPDAGQEGEQVALRFFLQRAADGGGHLILDPLFGMAADRTQLQRLDLALALDDGRAIEQGGETRAVERGRHRQDTQVRAQRRLRIERQRQAEIAVQAALMHFVEQHGRHAGQFGIILDTTDENALGQYQQARLRADLAVHPRRIADRAAGLLA